MTTKKNMAASKQVSTGKEEIIDGRRCSFFGKGEKAIIVFQDIFGYEFWLTRLMCEELAKNGYHVALHDYYDGDAWGLDQDMGEGFDDLFVWLRKFSWHNKVKSHTYKVVDALRERGAKTIGTLGFCSGAYLSFQFCSDELVKCAVGVHPSVHISGPVFDESHEEICSAVKCPHFLCTSTGDSPIFSPGGKMYEILYEKFGARNHHKNFPEASHGFVATGGVENDDVKLEKNVKEAMTEAVVFLNREM